MNDRRRATLDVWLLAGCQALFMTTSILTITIASIAASNLLDNLRLATLPQATIPLVAMAATLPAALLIRRIGRRAAFLLGAACGVVSGALCAFALMHESFGLFLAGVAMLGLYQAVATYYRFAVADHAPANLRARSVSFVLAGGVVAAVLGPSLGVATRDLVGTTPYLGSYLVTIALNLVALALLCGLKPHTPVPRADGHKVSLGKVLGQPRFLLAVCCCAIGQGTMMLVMTATPLAMLGHGHTLGFASLVISWHVLAMFVPSFFSGPLIARFGLRPILVAGIGFMALSCVVAILGESEAHFATALIVNGLAWNFLFVGGSTLLTGIKDADERALAQGMNELATFALTAVAAFGSGAVYFSAGWHMLNVIGIVAVLLAGLVLLSLSGRVFQAPPSQ